MSQEPHTDPEPSGVTSSPDAELDDQPMSIRAKVLTGVLAVIIVTGAAWLMLRVSSPPIAPGQKPPSGHYGLSCGFCHSTSSSAEAEVIR